MTNPDPREAQTYNFHGPESFAWYLLWKLAPSYLWALKESSPHMKQLWCKTPFWTYLLWIHVCCIPRPLVLQAKELVSGHQHCVIPQSPSHCVTSRKESLTLWSRAALESRAVWLSPLLGLRMLNVPLSWRTVTWWRPFHILQNTTTAT